MKTYPIPELLALLPGEYGKLAAKRYDALFSSESCCDNIAEAVRWGFDWGKTPEGNSFWRDVRSYALGHSALPPIPKQSPYTIPDIGNEITIMINGKEYRATLQEV